jgi:polyisoprenoid-binding protein YceI
MKVRYLALMPLLTVALLPESALAQVPVFAVTPGTSTIKFNVKASVPIAGNFDKWDATLTFTSTDVTTGVLDIKIQAATVDTGSGMKNDKLKSKDFFNVEQDPLITFKSTKIVQTGPTTFRHSRCLETRDPEADGLRRRHRYGRDHGPNGLRPQGLRNE